MSDSERWNPDVGVVAHSVELSKLRMDSLQFLKLFHNLLVCEVMVDGVGALCEAEVVGHGPGARVVAVQCEVERHSFCVIMHGHLLGVTQIAENIFAL